MKRLLLILFLIGSVLENTSASPADAVQITNKSTSIKANFQLLEINQSPNFINIEDQDLDVGKNSEDFYRQEIISRSDTKLFTNGNVVLFTIKFILPNLLDLPPPESL